MVLKAVKWWFRNVTLSCYKVLRILREMEEDGNEQQEAMVG